MRSSNKLRLDICMSVSNDWGRVMCALKKTGAPVLITIYMARLLATTHITEMKRWLKNDFGAFSFI